MSNFKQAVKWLKEGKKIRRNWRGKDVFIYMRGEYLYPVCSDGDDWAFGINDFEATDWEIYEVYDEFQGIVKEKLKKIEDDNKKS